MPAAHQRPRSQQGRQDVASPSPPQPTRKIFNCIVDDTALVAGVKKTTRNGIRQWVKAGQIRLFVPLHALEQLSRQKNGTSRHSEDVRETLQWLDDATSRYPEAVTLQGGDQYYATWTEVEQFAVPRTLFSEYDHIVDTEPDIETSSTSCIQDSVQDLSIGRKSPGDRNAETDPTKSGSHSSSNSTNLFDQSKMSLDDSLNENSPPTKVTQNGAQSAIRAPASVPSRYQPLFNYMLWRVHQELDPVAALEAFIFLCNDPTKTSYARDFDIRYKRLEQLREAIGREDRDMRNRHNISSRDGTMTSSITSFEASHSGEPESDDEVLFRPPSRALDPSPPRVPVTQVLDPHAFSRGGNAVAVEPPLSPRYSEDGATTPRMEGPRSPRGRGRNTLRGGRGRRGAPGVGRAAVKTDALIREPRERIDPDSFARPRGRGNARGSSRKLWVPS